MATTTFHDFYNSDLQSVYALCVVPIVFLAWLAFSPAARATARSKEAWRRFLYAYSVVFSVETMLDPFATGPVVRWLGVADSGAGTAILLTFVLLGDFRVYLLLLRLARIGRPLGEIVRMAAAWTLVVPIVAYAADSALGAVRPGLPSQTIWLLYELAFLSIALWLRAAGIARFLDSPNPMLQRALEAVAGYVAGYYALWATADVVILVLGLDEGWALRVVPNQLYYAFFLPFVWSRLASAR